MLTILNKVNLLKSILLILFFLIIEPLDILIGKDNFCFDKQQYWFKMFD